ncbi:MAG: hypothetical protein AAF432_02700 [Planctomycetota bacterium]
MCRLAAFALSLIMLIGCASTPEGPSVLTVEPAEYGRAFDVALATARDAGMTAELLDRRGGVIETRPRIAASVLEPWSSDISSLSQAVEHTLSQHRRFVRFEFEPVGFSGTGDPDALLAGPAVAIGDIDSIDRTRTDRTLELRVWVYLQQVSRPGQRRSTWSRQMSSETRSGPPNQGEELLPGEWWTTTSRDTDFERRLLAEIERRIASPASGEPNVITDASGFPQSG